MSQVQTRNCTLRLVAQGQTEPCPLEECVFWEPGGAVLEGRCMFDRLEIDVGREDLATYLLDVRARLEGARTAAQPEDARRSLLRRVGRDV